jgi:hypothetical protein
MDRIGVDPHWKAGRDSLVYRARRGDRTASTGRPLVADFIVVGLAAAIGFTVALFFATAAFPEGSLLDQAKMGALLSFIAAP